MIQVAEDVVFESDGREVLSLVVTGSSGTVTLEKLAGSDVTGTWVAVTDGTITNNGEMSFWAPRGQKFRCDITGDCAAFVTI